MGKVGKIIAVFLLLLGVVSIAMYFVYGSGTHTIKFDSAGGNNVESQMVKDNELANMPSNPVKDGYAFAGWYLGDVEYDFQTAVTKNITLVAKWKKELNIAVNLEGNDYTGKFYEESKINIADFNFPEREGYAVKLYNIDDTEYDMDSPLTSEINLKAQYVALKKYTVKFNTNGGSKVDNISVWEGSLITEPKTTKANYTFSGWYLNDNNFDFQTPVNDNITLVAKWTENNKVVVTFESDGKVYKTVDVYENTKVSKPSNPTKKGKVFEKWLLNNTEYDFETPVSSAITLVASYRDAQEFVVSFNTNGGSSIKSFIIFEGETLSKPDNPIRAGYKFVKWKLDNNKDYDFTKPVTSNLTLVAEWELESFKVTFDSNGGSFVQSRLVKNGDRLEEPTAPTKENATFDGWYLGNNPYDFTKPVTTAMTLVAHWRDN